MKMEKTKEYIGVGKEYLDYINDNIEILDDQTVGILNSALDIINLIRASVEVKKCPTIAMREKARIEGYGLCFSCENAHFESASPMPGYEITDCNADDLPKEIWKKFEDGEKIKKCPCHIRTPDCPECKSKRTILIHKDKPEHRHHRCQDCMHIFNEEQMKD